MFRVLSSIRGLFTMSSGALLTIPSRNIEIKAQIADEEAFQKKVAIAKQLTGSSGEIIKQHDVFFNADKGRLKLRYLEEDISGEMASVKKVKDLFNRGRGIVEIVEGRRTIELDDDYQHGDPEVEYLIENQPQEDDSSDAFKDLMRSLEYGYACHCICSQDASCTERSSCHMGGNYVAQGDELVLSENTDIIFECFKSCGCQETCLNRLVQFGPRKQLEIKQSLIVPQQLGLFTKAAIPKGAFISEYAGEILTRQEAERRNQFNDSRGRRNYILCLNELSSDQQIRTQTFIDPERKGNIGRYMNHSCDPNCFTVSVHIDGPPPRIGFFTQRSIAGGEELFFDYGGGSQYQIIGSTKKSELIQYFRPDVGGPKLSTYHKLDLDEPKLMETILAESIGIKGEVKKHRHLFLHDQTRIHLDDVEGLGHFLEFEVVLKPEQGIDEGTKIANEMMKKFEIEEKDLIQGAYMDKLLK